ncbi:MAG: DUF4339 domain-containing protein [Tannerella sp.]|jgi:hypothetical protein|nr:DUF4339 domain-containing protein [Tannerella sp.]
MENKEYFYLSGETKIGPFSLETLKSSPIMRNSLIWHSGLSNWAEAWTLPELAELFATQSPPPPPASPSGAAGTENIPSPPPWQANPTVIVNSPPAAKDTNGVGTAGFVLSLVGLFLGWIPVLGWLSWLTGLILSFVGIFKEPKGLAIAGLIISCIGLIVIILLAVFVGGLIGAIGMGL